jgi:hypothetical protein
MKAINFFLIFILISLVASLDDRKCWSSTWDDRKNEETLNMFKSKCAGYNLTPEFNGYAAYLSGCGYQDSIVSCCCNLKPWPKSQEELLDTEEKQLPEKSKNLLGQFKLYLSNIGRKVQISSLSSTLKNLLVGDITATVGTALAAGQLSFLSLDKIKDKYLEPMKKSFSKYLP